MKKFKFDGKEQTRELGKEITKNLKDNKRKKKARTRRK